MSCTFFQNVRNSLFLGDLGWHRHLTEFSLFHLSFAHVFLDDVFDSVFVLEDLVCQVLFGLFDRVLYHFRPLKVGLDQLLHLAQIFQIGVGSLF